MVESIEKLLADAELPQGTHRRVFSDMWDPDALKIALVSEYAEELVPPAPAGYRKLAPILRTEATVSGRPDLDWLAARVAALVEEHSKEWAFIHGAEYADALARAKAAA